MPKRTHQPKVGRKHRKLGFRARSASASGRKILGARRAKGRHSIAI